MARAGVAACGVWHVPIAGATRWGRCDRVHRWQQATRAARSTPIIVAQATGGHDVCRSCVCTGARPAVARRRVRTRSVPRADYDGPAQGGRSSVQRPCRDGTLVV